MAKSPTGPPPVDDSVQPFEQQLREMNEALLISLVRQTELTELAQQAEKSLQEEERVRQRQLALTNALRVSTIGELATGLAHELNQPLSSISNLAAACSQYVRAGTIGTDRLLDLLADIIAEAARAAGIIAHLRSFIDKGEAQLEPADLGEIASHVPHLLNRELERARVTLRVHLPYRKLPIRADPIQIEQVVVNLVQNAMDSIQEAAGPERVIELNARAIRGMGEISVRDTGAGVSESTAARMFDAFFTTKGRGLGMGLALSRSILEAHRGRIWMESPPDGGPGTIVRFEIPLTRAKKKRTSPAA